MHTWAHGEVMIPASAINQLKSLVAEGKVELVNENNPSAMDRAVFDAAYHSLELNFG